MVIELSLQHSRNFNYTKNILEGLHTKEITAVIELYLAYINTSRPGDIYLCIGSSNGLLPFWHQAIT